MVLFKTRHALEILESEARAAAFVGFTSIDLHDPSVRRLADRALHVCGWNPYKGTDAVLNAWSRHPEWPSLRVVSQLPMTQRQLSNIQPVRKRIAAAALHRLQNECVVHVCPSEVEGFGHTLVEALSCGTIVITTDAPPMNELITPGEGFLVRYSGTAAKAAGMRYFVDPEHLTETLDEVWRLDSRVRTQFAAAARARYESLTASFHRRLSEVLAGV
jgi:glycosyltransferase involved in cell wall biosynthesis